ncbi:hypothetical protein TrRE_jg2025 [Triparma retinervis]|uniref:Uncharacterized protein n=1 Tax=Triparma retinervis TaxID=2557542 RepID=A0A9W7EFF9_9STRA|nr:hypothetical protein TrRE_jg2025 [Triparma retinervis]
MPFSNRKPRPVIMTIVNTGEKRLFESLMNAERHTAIARKKIARVANRTTTLLSYDNNGECIDWAWANPTNPTGNGLGFEDPLPPSKNFASSSSSDDDEEDAVVGNPYKASYRKRTSTVDYAALNAGIGNAVTIYDSSGNSITQYASSRQAAEHLSIKKVVIEGVCNAAGREGGTGYLPNDAHGRRVRWGTAKSTTYPQARGCSKCRYSGCKDCMPPTEDRSSFTHSLFGGSGTVIALNDVPSYPAKMMKVKVSTPADSLPVSHPLRMYNVPPRTLMCSSCQKSRAVVRYNPCGHVVVCSSCNPGIGGWCTWCNLTIQGFKIETPDDSRSPLATTRPTNENSGGMKCANDLERRVKGFRIPDEWDVYKDESSHYLITNLKTPEIEFTSKQRCLDWIRENTPLEFSEVRRERESYLKETGAGKSVGKRKKKRPRTNYSITIPSYSTSMASAGSSAVRTFPTNPVGGSLGTQPVWAPQAPQDPQDPLFNVNEDSIVSREIDGGNVGGSVKGGEDGIDADDEIDADEVIDDDEDGEEIMITDQPMFPHVPSDDASQY